MMRVSPTTYPIAWFRDRNTEKNLVLKPPYQRKPVWSLGQKTFLIDSIIKKYHIPEIYIHRVMSGSGQVSYNIVDGQQRIRTILEFLNGEFRLSEKDTPEYPDYIFSDLPENVRTDILNYTIFARDISDANEEDVRNLFRRMNKNVVALEPQELRHATYGNEFIQLMEETAEDEFWAENKIVTPTEIRRMKDVQFISDLYISMMNGIQDKTKEMDYFYELYNQEPINKSEWKEDFYKVRTTITKIFPKLRETRWKNKSDFYTLFMVISQQLDKGKAISSSNSNKARAELTKFAEKVNSAAKKEQKGTGVSKEIAAYTNAVTKSTTDKDRRALRHRIIDSLLSKYFSSKK